MKYNSQNNLSAVEQLQGTVERVTFHSETNGFCVLRTKVKKQRNPITIIGNAPSITAGEYVECHGIWINDKTHGLQFKATTLNVVQPTTLDGIEKYLGSGMVKGIGSHFAKKLVGAFGDSVFDVIEETPEKLVELEGIGTKRQQQITSAWGEQKIIRRIMVFLHSNGVGTARAVRIYKTYGNDAVSLVKENPYKLALDIKGIGFKTADALAEKLGIARNSLIRAQAGVRHVLQELCNDGHCAVELEKLQQASIELLEIDEPIIDSAISMDINEGNIVKDLIDDKECMFLSSLYQAEKNSAELLIKLSKGCTPWGSIADGKVIQWVEKKTKLALSASQTNAIKKVLKSKVSIITGGAGVGKTTIVNSLLKIIRAKKISVALCAPTGRAAKKLQEATGMEAKTIHRLLDFDHQNWGFKHNQENKLDLDVLIVDEVSMVDIALLYSLLKAIPKHAGLLFVGDVDQLPSVGSGAVLLDMINSGVVTTVRLTEIFRQAKDSKIILNSHRINQGKMPLDNTNDSDFYVMCEQDPEIIHDKLLDVVTKRIPKHYKCNPVTDIQVLTPMNRGGLGTRSLNIALQQSINGNHQNQITKFGTTFSPGDKVIQNVNNYDKEIYNGDIGIIKNIDISESLLNIEFDGNIIEYDFNELDEINLAYAISIHKSQGSEFPIIVVPVVMQHYMLLARNLLYTAVTRGKKLVVLIGQKKAIRMAVHNNQENKRLTKLSQRIIEMNKV